MQILMVHGNVARVDGGRLRVDRKFHLGMSAYVKALGVPLVSVHPLAARDEAIMDAIVIDVAELGYGVATVAADAHGRISVADSEHLDGLIAASALVYGGGFGSEALARHHGVPYIQVLEYDLGTKITVTISQVRNPLRKAVRALRTLHAHVRGLRDKRLANALHCNGYPVFDEAARVNAHRLLYLDSRMTAALVISETTLRERLARRGQRPLRLLYSGRYEALKGADDAVRVALLALVQGLNVEMHCYGQGSLAEPMRALAAQSLGRVQVHDAVPYPELVEISSGFDVFVCCHRQGDPSCTYLEAFGAGLPVVGYANAMWRRLQQESGVGNSSPMGDIGAVVRSLKTLAADPPVLATHSMRARAFALEHTFEREFALRTDALRTALGLPNATTPLA